MAIINYLNLTNGLEYKDKVNDYKFVRIQSTLCEAKCWDKLIRDLDYNFLLDLAQGNTIYIYDASSKKNETRALYQGIEFVRYVLIRRWFNAKSADIPAVVNGHNVNEYFEIEYKKLSKEAKRKLDYVKKFVNTKGIYIKRICKKSLHDGDYQYYKELLRTGV